jgi:negative regulator of flagellin synthesis FlgM
MKILGNIGVYNSYDKNASKNAKDKAVTANNKSNKDKVEISNQAINKNVKNTEVEYLKNRLNAMDDREARLADLKAQISAGTYNVSSEDVADAILESKKV